MSGPRITLEGLQEVTGVLQELPKRVQRSVARKAARAGGAVYLKAARANAPVRNNLLKRSLVQVIRAYPNGNVVALIGQEKHKAFKRKKRLKRGGISGRGDLVPVHLVEEPTKPRTITSDEKASIRFRDKQGKRRTKQFVARAQTKPIAFSLGKGKKSTDIIRMSARHPGTRGKHFLRRAADTATPAALRAFETKAAEEILREAQKVRPSDA